MTVIDEELKCIRKSAVEALDEWQGVVDVGGKGWLAIKSGCELGYRHDTS